MRRAYLLLLALLFASPAGAQPRTLPTDAAHELIWTPPAPVPVRGPRFAPVTVEVYATFSHTTSAAAAEVGRRLLARGRPGEVRLLIYPSPFGPPGADLAAELALFAAAEGLYHPFIDRLLPPRGAPALTPAELIRAAREAGLDEDKLNEAIAARTFRAAAEHLGNDARAASHTPGEVLLNGRRLSPYSSEDQLTAALREAGRRAEALRENGVPLGQLHERLLEALAEDTPSPFVAAGPSAGSSAGSPLRRARVEWPEERAPTRGASLAPITIVYYSNLAYPPAFELHALARQLRARFPGRVREVWKHAIPSTMGLEPWAAELAAAAAEQGRLFALVDLLVDYCSHRTGATPNTYNSARLQREELEALATRAGVDLEAAARDARSGRLRALVEHDALTSDPTSHPAVLGRGPTLLMNGIPLGPGGRWEWIERLARDELSRTLLDRLNVLPGEVQPGKANH